jgi:predicted amidohydrolase
MSTTKLYHFVRIAHKNGVKLVLLGEYLFNSFFKELQNTPISMLKEQSEHHIRILRDLAANYGITFVAPLVVVRRGEPYKCIVKIAPTSVSYYYQQILINYAHWNEEKFFANEAAPLGPPMTFRIDGMKFAVMGGFELHFDPLWTEVMRKNVDCVLLPTISTFESRQRWRDIIRSRAFTNNCYVLRANRVGEYQEADYTWKFYGDSLLMNPQGELEMSLGDTEELMIVDLRHDEVLQARRDWGFKDALSKRI